VQHRTTPRRQFRVLTRTRGGYDGGVRHDVQLQVADTGALVWAQTFSDERQAHEFQQQLEDDLDALDPSGFRTKYGVPSTT
jgi:hypothetical protein